VIQDSRFRALALTSLVAVGVGCAALNLPLRGQAQTGKAVPTLTPVPRYLDAFDDAEPGSGDFAGGVLWDAQHGAEEFLRANPRLRGPIPPPPAQIAELRIVVSLAGLTCRIYDPKGGFERTFPVGVGVRTSDTGRSITPTGEFSTHPDPDNTWYYTWERWVPEYFAGLPFLRLDIIDADGHPTYGLHGPIAASLSRGYVSHGCVRMRGEDVQEVFRFAHAHPGSPVTIQEEPDYDRYGLLVDVDMPRLQPAEREWPAVRLAAPAEVRVELIGPGAAPIGVPARFEARIAGPAKASVVHLLFNAGGRSNGRTSGLLAPGQPFEIALSNAGATEIFAIALDRDERPIAFGSARLDVR
jgi:lipoprotein-anchoring transpeptidase ErfK/SrfK